MDVPWNTQCGIGGRSGGRIQAGTRPATAYPRAVSSNEAARGRANLREMLYLMPQGVDPGGFESIDDAGQFRELGRTAETHAESDLHSSISPQRSGPAGGGPAGTRRPGKYPRSTMTFTPFELEAWQSRYEHEVEYNLADSGVHPVRVDELVTDPTAVSRLLDVELGYPPVGGTDALRALIADWQGGGARADNVLVTVGAAEANAITIATLVEPGSNVVVMEPGYRQVRGCALNLGAAVEAFPLDPARGWRPDLDALAAAVTPATRLIAVTNPNNPAGTILTEEEMDAVVAAAARVGAWILGDEVYRGTERLTDQVTPSFFGRYDKVVCVGSLSKAFGLPGLRTGWLVAPRTLVEDAWRRHEYATISTGAMSMYLAEIALQSPVRDSLIARGRELIHNGYSRLEQWVDASQGLLSIVPPAATALGFVRYHFDVPSLDVADALRTQAGVLVGAGAHFGAEGHLRIAHGLEPAYLDAGLQRMSLTLDRLAHSLRGGLRNATEEVR